MSAGVRRRWPRPRLGSDRTAEPHRHLRSVGCSAKSSVADRMSHGTATAKYRAGSRVTRSVPSSRRGGSAQPASAASGRPPAVRGGSPSRQRPSRATGRPCSCRWRGRRRGPVAADHRRQGGEQAGKVSSVPPPARELTTPAASEERTSSTSVEDDSGICHLWLQSGHECQSPSRQRGCLGNPPSLRSGSDKHRSKSTIKAGDPRALGSDKPLSRHRTTTPRYSSFFFSSPS